MKQIISLLFIFILWFGYPSGNLGQDTCKSGLCEIVFYTDSQELSTTEKLVEQNKQTSRVLNVQTRFMLEQTRGKSVLPSWSIVQRIYTIVKTTCPVDNQLLSGVVRLMREYINEALESFHSPISGLGNMKMVERLLGRCLDEGASRKPIINYEYVSKCGEELEDERGDLFYKYTLASRKDDCQCIREPTTYELNGKTSPLVYNKTDTLKTRDFVVESFWLIFENVYNACSHYFKQNSLQLSKLYMFYENIVRIEPLLFRWTNPGNSWLAYNRAFPMNDLYKFYTTLKACSGIAIKNSHAPKITSPADTIMKRACLKNDKAVPCVTKCSGSKVFNCGDNYCIPKEMLCNGKPDCFNGADEENERCSHFCTTLGDSLFCARSTCVRSKQRCDGQYNCKDLSDETCTDCQKRCTHAKGHYCNSQGNHCVREDLICNGHPDCHDLSDENEDMCRNLCEAKGGHFCSGEKNKCLAAGDICNGIMGCLNSSDEDEQYCRKRCEKASGHFCGNEMNKCLDKNLTCNNKSDCIDGSDEYEKTCRTKCTLEFGHYCKGTGFSHQCLPRRLICNNHADCLDASDENQDCHISTSTETCKMTGTHQVGSVHGVQWVKTKQGQIPADSYLVDYAKVGQKEAAYIVRKVYSNKILIGKYVPGYNSKAILVEDEKVVEEDIKNVEILQVTGDAYWKRVVSGSVPLSAVPAGLNQKGEVLFICRAVVDLKGDKTIPKQKLPGYCTGCNKKALVPWGNQVQDRFKYEVLVSD